MIRHAAYETPPKKQPLTERQRAVFDFIAACVAKNGYQPSYREIGQKFGIGPTNGVACHIRALERKGWIKRRKGGLARAIRIVG